MLVKFITSIYDEKRATKDPELRKMSLADFVFDILLRKFGMKKAAVNKFNHILTSCMKYKFIHRVRVFGRLIGLYEPFENEDSYVYIDYLNNYVHN